MKVLNLYAGIGGNRKLWEGVEVTAVEWDKATAEVYADYFPNDTVIVGDAHQYLLDNYKEFDFIWSSPPCPTHSDIRRMAVKQGQYDALFPDMTLYQEILLLKHFTDKAQYWVVENVIPYYEPLIKPTKKIHRHIFWSNFKIGNQVKLQGRKNHQSICGNSHVYGISLNGTGIKDKRKALRNMVDPQLGLHILNRARNIKESEATEQGFLFV